MAESSLGSWVRHSLPPDNNLKLTQQRKAGYALPSPFTWCPVDAYQYVSTGNSSLCPRKQYLFARAIHWSGTLLLPGCLPARLPHTRLAPSPAFLVLAAKSAHMLNLQPNPDGLCAVQLWGNLGQLSYEKCIFFLDFSSI